MVRIVYTEAENPAETMVYFTLYNKLNRKLALVECMSAEVMRDITTGCHNYHITLLTLEEIEVEIGSAISLIKSVNFGVALVKAKICENLVVAMEFIKQLEKSLRIKADECRRIYTGVIKAKDKYYAEVNEKGESGKVMEAIVYTEGGNTNVYIF